MVCKKLDLINETMKNLINIIEAKNTIPVNLNISLAMAVKEFCSIDKQKLLDLNEFVNMPGPLSEMLKRVLGRIQ